MNPFLATDGYKTGHHMMYPEGTTLVYSNFTPRSDKHAPKSVEKGYIISFGQQMVMRQIKEMFDEYFFLKRDKREQNALNKKQYNELISEKKKQVCDEIKKEYSLYLGIDYDVSHIEALWDLGYLPIKVKALPEGTKVPIGVPVLTIYNTKPEFYWLTNFLETLISNLLWKPMTSATIAYNYKKNLLSWAEKTDRNNKAFVDFQGHDFSMRGMDSIDATIASGLGHATSFLGSDSLPVIHGARKYYDEKDAVVHSVNATEHSVMCAGTKGDEIGTFRYLMKQFPTGILSIVSDTWDLWKVITEYLPQLKEEILSRDGKLVIRPDSGDPVDIICGTNCNINFIETQDNLNDFILDLTDGIKFKYNNIYYESHDIKEFNREYGINAHYQIWVANDLEGLLDNGLINEFNYQEKPENKGVVELLWNIFGGTINKQGYKVLNPKIGAIYGDSITIERAEEICKRLEAKGFTSTNIVLGIGSFTYQYNTRDTFGFAMKATYVEVKKEEVTTITGKANVVEGREIFKDPVTDDGTKKSAKGLLSVGKINDGNYYLQAQVSWNIDNNGELQTIFEDGKFYNETTLTEIRKRLK